MTSDDGRRRGADGALGCGGYGLPSSTSGERISRPSAPGARHDPDDVAHVERTACSRAIAQHDQAERACDRHDRRASGARLLQAQLIHPQVAVLFFLPHLTAAGPAAQRAGPMIGHFGDRRTGHSQRLARRLDDAILAAEIARVVVGDQLLGQATLQLQPTLRQQFLQELGVVDDGWRAKAGYSFFNVCRRWESSRSPVPPD
jgi:hypothetical protein